MTKTGLLCSFDESGLSLHQPLVDRREQPAPLHASERAVESVGPVAVSDRELRTGPLEIRGSRRICASLAVWASRRIA